MHFFDVIPDIAVKRTPKTLFHNLNVRKYARILSRLEKRCLLCVRNQYGFDVLTLPRVNEHTDDYILEQ